MAGNKCSPRTKRHEALEHRNLQEAMKQIHNELRKHSAGTQWETSSAGTEGIFPKVEIGSQPTSELFSSGHSLEEPCHILHSLSFWIGRWLELLESKPLLRMSPIYQHAGCQQRWFTRRTEVLTITDFTFHPSLWSRKDIDPQQHGHQDLWSNIVRKDTNES